MKNLYSTSTKVYVYLLIIVLLFIHPLQAQITGTGGFLQGQYVEVGVGPCGSFGANAAPAGYHPNVGTNLGFVCDHERNGWTTSSGPGASNYCGDYFVPGSPYEAWGIQIGTGPTSTMRGNHSICGSVTVPGGVLSNYSTAGSVTSVDWDGDMTAGGYNVHIKQRTIVPDTGLYFGIQVTLTNNGAVPINDVFYMRNVDPDNDQPWSFDFVTTNIIERQPTDTNCYTALVSGEGNTFGCYLGLFSRGYPDARAFMQPIGFGFPGAAGSIGNMWNGVGAYTTVLGTTVVSDNGIGIVHRWATINPGETVEFTFYYVLDFDEIQTLSQNTEVALNGIDALLVDSASAASDCDTVYNDTLTYVAFYCNQVNNILTLDAAYNYDFTWFPNPDLTVLNALGDSVEVNPSNDTVIYQAQGVYFTGSDSMFLTINLILLYEFLEADFVTDTSCVGTMHCFTDTSSSSFGIIQSWLWDFDEAGMTSTLENPCVILNNDSPHNVQLIVSSPWGCRDTMVRTVTPFSLPSGFILDSVVCEDLSLTYHFIPSPGDSITNYSWSFVSGTPASSSLSEPTITYPSVGTHSINLIVTNVHGCVDSIVDNVLVRPNPVASFTITQVCSDEYTFNDNSTPASIIDSLFWNLGNGNTLTSTNSNPFNVVYDSLGTVSVTLNIIDQFGCVDSITQNVNINNYFAQIVSPTTDTAVCLGDAPVTIIATGGDNYVWTPALGLNTTTNDTVLANPNVTTTYIVRETFDVLCPDADTITITVYPKPTVNFDATRICDDTYLFENNSTPVSSIISHAWNLGDGTLLNLTNTNSFEHIYLNNGNYMITLLVTDNNGCFNIDSLPITVSILQPIKVIVPNILVHSSTNGNNVFDLDILNPAISLTKCYDHELSIFNRWGVEVFKYENKKANPDTNCDRCFKGLSGIGNILEPGTYYYVLKGEKNIEEKGFIEIFD